MVNGLLTTNQKISREALRLLTILLVGKVV